MRENTMHRVHRLAVLVFMAAVTACLLALVFEQATRGPSGLLGGVIFALARGLRPGVRELGVDRPCGRALAARPEPGPLVDFEG